MACGRQGCYGSLSMMFWAAVGAVNACMAIGCGAFAAHALRSRLDAERLAAFETGARYQMYHALALIGVAWLGGHGASANMAGGLMLAGIVLFSGSLYALAISGRRKLGAITPIGGLCFLVGWAEFAWVAMKW